MLGCKLVAIKSYVKFCLYTDPTKYIFIKLHIYIKVQKAISLCSA